MDPLTTAINAAFDAIKAQHRLRSDRALARHLGTNAELIRRCRIGQLPPALRVVGPVLLAHIAPKQPKKRLDIDTPV